MSDAERSGVGRREVAYRIFAAEYDDADFSYSESTEDRAPNYVITPTGARVNRLFVVGVLTEVEQVSDDVLRARVVDPTGAFVLYAGQYQPDEQAFLERADPPTFVAVTGKARTFQPDDSEQIYTSVRPESINEVDGETRDKWNVQAAEQTLDRIEHMGAALASERSGESLETALLDSGVDEGLAQGISLAVDHYGTTPTYLQELRRLALDAARVVAGKRDEVRNVVADPDQEGSATARDLTDRTLDVPPADATEEATAGEAESIEETETSKPSSTESTTAEPPSTETTAEPASSEPTSTDSPSAETTSTESPSAETTSTESPSADTTSASTDEEGDSPETTPTAETDAEPESASLDSTAQVDDEEDELGDFEATEVGTEEFELEEETREEIEEEYGTEFQSGTEVDEPGAADIDTTPEQPVDEEGTPKADEAPDTPATGESPASDQEGEASSAEPDVDGEALDEEPSATAAKDEEPSTTGADESGDEPPADLEATVVEVMTELDEGDGAERSDLVATVTDRHGVSSDEVEEAIQSALMDGKCYEPTDESFKPI